jgi:hypothetical protein
LETIFLAEEKHANPPGLSFKIFYSRPPSPDNSKKREPRPGFRRLADRTDDGDGPRRSAIPERHGPSRPRRGRYRVLQELAATWASGAATWE